jgi:hypothetical protein
MTSEKPFQPHFETSQKLSNVVSVQQAGQESKLRDRETSTGVSP